MSNIIQFPGSKLSSKGLLDEKFDKESRDLPPKLSKCLKEAYKRVNERYAANLPGFELHIADLNDTQIEQIKATVAQLMADYTQRALSMLECIMALEAEICMLKFRLEFPSTPNH